MQERLVIADEIVALAEQVNDNERTAAGRLYRVIANMELGRIGEAEQELEVIAQEAARLRQPAQLWMATASRANLALFQGKIRRSANADRRGPGSRRARPMPRCRSLAPTTTLPA